MPAFCCFCGPDRRRALVDAGWSSPVARQAHNLKVVGSNPTPATIEKPAFPMGSRAFFALCGLDDRVSECLIWEDADVVPSPAAHPVWNDGAT